MVKGSLPSFSLQMQMREIAEILKRENIFKHLCYETLKVAITSFHCVTDIRYGTDCHNL